MATAVGFESIEQHEAVARARAELAPILARREALETERARAWRIGGRPTTYSHEPAESVTEEEVIGARLVLRTVDDDLRRLRIAELPAERALDAARRQARAELLAQVDGERRKVVAKLDRKLRETEAINAELVALDEQATAAGGNSAAMAAWAELMPETASFQSRISCWRASMRAAGLLD